MNSCVRRLSVISYQSRPKAIENVDVEISTNFARSLVLELREKMRSVIFIFLIFFSVNICDCKGTLIFFGVCSVTLLTEREKKPDTPEGPNFVADLRTWLHKTDTTKAPSLGILSMFIVYLLACVLLQTLAYCTQRTLKFC